MDFDGVMHRYSRGWHDGSIYDRPMKGTKKALAALKKKFKIVIFSRRAVFQGMNEIRSWLNKNNIPYDTVTKIKPRASWYIDDKAIHFTDWTKAVKEIKKLERNRKIGVGA